MGFWLEIFDSRLDPDKELWIGEELHEKDFMLWTLRKMKVRALFLLMEFGLSEKDDERFPNTGVDELLRTILIRKFFKKLFMKIFKNNINDNFYQKLRLKLFTCIKFRKRRLVFLG